ncbi:MAG: uroporphyrinogen decarboxylase family protein [Methanosarcinaceae archaeon]
MSYSNHKEKMLAALNFEPVESVPICGPFQGYWALEYSNVSVQKSFDNPALAAEAQLKVLEKCDFDALEVLWDWQTPLPALGCEVNITDVGGPSTRTHVVSDASSLEALEIPDPSQDKRLKSGIETAAKLIDVIGDERYTYYDLMAPFTLAGELRGVEVMMLDLYTDPDFVKELLSFSTETLKVYNKYLMDSLDVDGVFMCDPTASGNLISKATFETYSQPYMTDLSGTLKAAGRDVMIHICGDVSDRVGSIVEIPHDVLSVDLPVGLAAARKVMGEKVTLLGNLDVANTLFNGTPDDVRAQIRTCIESTGGVGHILAGGCDIAPGTPMENVEIWKDNTNV